MRDSANAQRILRFLEALGNRVKGPGRVYLVGGSTSVLYGIRSSTADVDLKFSPEPSGVFEAIAELKDTLDINVELAAPDQFIPPVPGWETRSIFVGRFGPLDVFHYDLLSQALAKIERSHPRDTVDVKALLEQGLVSKEALWNAFSQIEPLLLRYPGVSSEVFRHRMVAALGEKP